jgi:transposase
VLVQAQIRAVEREEVGLLAQTPYLLLMAIPGFNVVSAAEYAAEAGPPEHYSHPNQITGRAGLVPSRYQSDRIDHRDGPLVRHGNRALRGSLMQIAANLLKHNHHFSAKGLTWRRLGKHPCRVRVKAAKSFSRISFGIVMSGEIRSHPCLRDAQTILDKLLAFHRVHGTAWPVVGRDLNTALAQIPSSRRAAEAVPVRQKLQALQTRRRGPQPLASILALVLARLGEDVIESPPGESASCPP